MACDKEYTVRVNEPVALIYSCKPPDKLPVVCVVACAALVASSGQLLQTGLRTNPNSTSFLVNKSQSRQVVLRAHVRNSRSEELVSEIERRPFVSRCLVAHPSKDLGGCNCDKEILAKRLSRPRSERSNQIECRTRIRLGGLEFSFGLPVPGQRRTIADCSVAGP